MARPRFSLKLRLAPLWPVLSAGLVAALLIAVLLPRLLAEYTAERLLTAARTLQKEVASRLNETGQRPLHRWVHEISAESELRITVVRPDGQVIADSARSGSQLEAMDNHAQRPEIQQAAEEGWGWSLRDSSTTLRRYVYVALAVPAKGDQQAFILRVAEPLAELSGARNRLFGILAFAAFAALGVTAGHSWWVDRRLFRPLAELIAGARELADGRYDHRLAAPRAQELAQLSRSLNRLAQSVEEQIDAVADERDHLQAILSSTSEGVMVIDGRGKTALVNPAFRDIFGIEQEATGRYPLEVVRNPEIEGTLNEALERGKAGIRQIEIPPPRPRTVTLAADALDTESGGAVLTARDTTEYTRLTIMRREFVANVSHELKTPLAAIRGYAETLRDGALEEAATAERFVVRILEQCHRLQALLDDLLVLSRLESVEAPFEKRTFEVGHLVDRATEVLRGAADARRVTLHIEPCDAGAARALLRGDEVSLERMLVNLLDNAIKYNHQGGSVHLSYGIDDGAIVFTVQDTGLGIPEESQPRIFERFYRVDKGRSRDAGGTGLGLAIVKHVVQGHDGQIEVDSSVGEGTRFRVTIPRNLDTEDPKADSGAALDGDTA